VTSASAPVDCQPAALLELADGSLHGWQADAQFSSYMDARRPSETSVNILKVKKQLRYPLRRQG